MRRTAVVAAVLLAVAQVASALPVGTVSVSNLDFGQVEVGSHQDLSVTIRNTGDLPLTGSIGEGCDPFEITTGGGPYTLAPNATLSVTVRFEPTADGDFGCTLHTSSCRCSDVTLSGSGYGAPADEPAICDVSPTTLDFGTLVPGASAYDVFRVKNVGGSILTGTISEACPNYAIAFGSGAYSLAAGESTNVVVKFTAPASNGTYECSVLTGGAVFKGIPTCSNVSCTGVSYTPQAICSVSPTNLAFGTLVVDSTVSRSFVIKNTGDVGSTSTGLVSGGTTQYTITAGDGAFSLAAGESVTVTVALLSSSAGTFATTIETGTANCIDVPCSGLVTAGAGAGDLAEVDFTYDGAFKFGSTGSTLGYGAGRGLGILSNGDLVVSGTDILNTGTMVVCAPATPIITTNVAAMNQATTVATYSDPTGGRWQTEGDYSRSEDIIVLDDRIAYTFFSYYDRAYDARGGLGFLNLSFGSPTGLFYPGNPDSVLASVGNNANTRKIWYPGKICGQGQQVPAAYVEGGRKLAIGRSRDEYGEDCSAGPSLYLVDPDDVTNAVCALCYDQIGVVGTDNPDAPHSRPDYSLTDQITDMAWIGSTVLFTTNKCQYDSHYYTPGFPPPLNDPGVCNESHGYTCGLSTDDLPGYLGRFELYHADDLMAVAHGELNNWEPLPYLTFSVSDDLIDASCTASMGGAVWDEAHRYLYVIQLRKNGDGPICHRWSVANP